MYYATTNCTGATAAINAGGVAAVPLYGKTVVRSSTGQFYKVASFNSTTFESLSATGLFTKNSIDNLPPSGCGTSSATAANGWLLTAINSTDVGIPAAIATPLQFP
jgi:hypothetical protein